MRALNTSSELALQPLAEAIVRRGLQVPAIFFLELHKPLSTLLHHGSLALTPALSPVFGLERMQSVSTFLSNRDNIEQLIVKIETLARQKA